jgi:nucleoside-diphosphate-sugar epimerase
VCIAVTPVPGKAAERYVPDATLARKTLGLSAQIGVPDAISRTVEWLRMGQ